MKNYVRHPAAVPLTAPVGGISSGEAYLFGSLFGVAATDAEAGDAVTIHLEGCFTLPKNVGESLAEGAEVYWDGAEITGLPDTAGTVVGHVVEAAGSSATTVVIRISN